MLHGKKFRYNKDVIAKTEAYFEGKNKSYKKGIKVLENSSSDFIALLRNYVDE